MKQIIAVPILPVPGSIEIPEIPHLMHTAMTHGAKFFTGGLFAFEVIGAHDAEGAPFAAMLVLTAKESITLSVEQALCIVRPAGEPVVQALPSCVTNLAGAFEHLENIGYTCASWTEYDGHGYSYQVTLVRTPEIVQAFIDELQQVQPN